MVTKKDEKAEEAPVEKKADKEEMKTVTGAAVGATADGRVKKIDHVNLGDGVMRTRNPDGSLSPAAERTVRNVITDAEPALDPEKRNP